MLHDFFIFSLPWAYQILLTWSVSFWSFRFISVSGSVIWVCHTRQEKIKKTNLGRGNGKPVSLWVMRVFSFFFIIKLLGVNKCQRSPVSWTGTCSNGWFDRTAVCSRANLMCLPWLAAVFGRSALWQVFADGNIKESVMRDQVRY